MTGSEPQEAREVRDLLERLARDVEPDLAQGEARIGARLHEGASLPVEDRRVRSRRSLALVVAAAAIVVVALVVGVVALVGDGDRVETTPAEGGPAGREVLFSAPGGPAEVMDAYLADRFGGATDHLTVVPPRSLGGGEALEGRWVTTDPAGPGGTDIEAGAPPLFGGAVHLEPGPGGVWDVVRSDTAAVAIVDLLHDAGRVSGTVRWSPGPLLADADARLEVRDLAGALVHAAAPEADPGGGLPCEPCELDVEIPDVGDATVIVRFQLHVGGVPVSLTEVLLRSGDAHVTATTTLPPPEGADQGCEGLAGDEPAVGTHVVSALPPGFAPDGPLREEGSDLPDEEPGAMGGVRQVEQRFSDPQGRWIVVVDFNAELPAQVIEDAHAGGTVTTESVPRCMSTAGGIASFESTVTVSSTGAQTVVGVQEWEYGGQLVIGGPDVARDEVLLVMSGLRRRGDFSEGDAEKIVSDFLRFAHDPSAEAIDRLPLAEEVQLGLGSELRQTRSRTQLADPAAWVIDEEIFRAYSGPFSALDIAAGAERTVVAVGEHPHCASPPMPPPDEVARLTRVSVQPDLDEGESCLSWWTVDLYVNETGQIEAATLDLWEP